MTIHVYSYSTLLVLMMALMASASMAFEGPRVFKVGDDLGWRVPLPNDTVVYSHWASTNRFHIGDSLSFVYDKDSVMEVDKYGFYHCNASDPIMAFDNGNSTFELDRPGLFYFISGNNGHCTSGQRLIVEVMHVHHHHQDRQHDIVPMSPSMSPIYSTPGSDSASSASPFAAAAFLTIAPFVSFLVTLL